MFATSELLKTVVAATLTLEKLKETEYFNDANKSLLLLQVETCIWRPWGHGTSLATDETALSKVPSVVKTWELANFNVGEMEIIHERLGALRTFVVPASPSGYSSLVDKLKAVQPLYWKYSKKDEFWACFKVLKDLQSRRKKCIEMLDKFSDSL